jgi:hypothetical protein
MANGLAPFSHQQASRRTFLDNVSSSMAFLPFLVAQRAGAEEDTLDDLTMPSPEEAKAQDVRLSSKLYMC